MSFSSYEAPPIVASESHDVLFQLPLEQNGVPKPFPSKYTDFCSKPAVEMPNSASNKQMWERICEHYKSPIRSFDDLRRRILSYNKFLPPDNIFAGLREYIEKTLSEKKQREFFDELLPQIIRLALSLPQEVTRPVPLLMKQCSASLSISQKQIGVLLANAFLCTFPSRNRAGERCKYGDLPNVNFDCLFQRHQKSHIQHKFRCIFNYFSRITTTEPVGVVTFSRCSFPQFPDFRSSSKSLSGLKLETNGVIEEADNHLQIDFADRYIGGLVLSEGCVQEEIRFLLCPELIVSCLFTEVLQDNEAFIFTGVEQYSKAKGYSRKFQFVSSFQDKMARDAFNRRKCQLAAIDAKHFPRGAAQQYEPMLMLREIKKAYAGFCPIEKTTGPLMPVATGNWGCGVFHGDPRLKSLLQLIAAGEVGRDLKYFAFGNKDIVKSLGSLYNYLKKKCITVGQLTSILLSYEENKNKIGFLDLYDYIRQQVEITTLNSST